MNSASIGTGGRTRDAVTDREDVLIPSVLVSIAVNFNLALRVTNAGVKEELVLSGGGVDTGPNEVLFDGFTGVYVLEHSNFGLSFLAYAQ